MGLKGKWNSFKQDLKQDGKDSKVKAAIKEDPSIKEIINELNIKDIKELDKWHGMALEVERLYNIKMNELLETEDKIYWNNIFYFRTKLLFEYYDREIQKIKPLKSKVQLIKKRNELRRFKLADATLLRFIMNVYEENVL